MLRDPQSPPHGATKLTAPPAPPHPSALSALPRSTALPSHPLGEREARLAFRDGEKPGVLEILSFDAAGACTVHRVSGLALANLAVKATEQLRRGMSAC